MGITEGEVDLWNYTPEKYDCACGKKLEKHIKQEGARYHVLFYNKGVKCSASECETNHNCLQSRLKRDIKSLSETSSLIDRINEELSSSDDVSIAS